MEKEEEAGWKQKGVIYSFNARTKQYTPLKVDLLYDLQKHALAYNILKAAENVNKPLVNYSW